MSGAVGGMAEPAMESDGMDSVIVTDAGFSAGKRDAEVNGRIVDLAPDADPGDLRGDLADIALIRVDFPGFSDGRGFTIARRLRAMGFAGRLRARGHVIADQYAMARRAGFDDVEISRDLATRQPEDQWLARADWAAHNYQARLRG